MLHIPSDDHISRGIQNVNRKQRIVLNICDKWVKDYTEALFFKKETQKLILFIHLYLVLHLLGNHIVITIYQAAFKEFLYHGKKI